MDILRRGFLSRLAVRRRKTSRGARKPEPLSGFMGAVIAASLALACLAGAPAYAQPDKTITVASTTSTEQSGLFKHLLPRFTQKTGIEVKVVALGTGQALDVGRRGDADVVFVHDRAAEEKFVADGFGMKRHEVMYNDFVIVGPKDDPAKAAGKDVIEGLRRIAAARAPFISRGDRSGTHAAELHYWTEAGVDLNAVKGDWYREIGQGMGPALNTASASNAYVLADRGTWLAFRNRGDLAILVEGDQRLFNQYGVMLVSPAKHPQVKTVEGQGFIDWLVSGEGQKAIADYKIEGEQLFFPNAGAAGRS
jgi:tungstate transport system substrate-binding protein